MNEIVEAQRMAQIERLSTGKAGRWILYSLGIRYHEQPEQKTTMTYEIRKKVRVDRVPTNVRQKCNRGRRKARAKGLTDVHRSDKHTRFVAAAEWEEENRFVFAVVNAAGATRTAASIRSNKAAEGEEIDIALGLTDLGCGTVLTDLNKDVRNYTKERISLNAVHILEKIRTAKELPERVRFK